MFTRIIVLSAVLASGIAAAHALDQLGGSRQSGSAVLAAHHHHHVDNDDLPEPGTLALLAAGLIGAAGLVRALRRNRHQQDAA